MKLRILWVSPVLLLITSTILLCSSPEPGTIELSSAQLAQAAGNEIEPFDAPGEAQELYRLKRVPAGQPEIPVERYFAADDQMKLMPLYSSYTKSFGPTLASWTSLGPGNIGGRTRALVVDRLNPTIMYAGGVAGGIWKSTNGGTSWNPKGDLLPNLAVCSLAMDPSNSSVLYAGTGEGFFNPDSVRGGGVMKSTDAGETWSPLNSNNLSEFYYVNDIVVAPSGNVYAATGTGVWRSKNGGANWTQVFNPNIFLGCLDLAVRTDQTTNDYVFASFGSRVQATIYRNINAGSGSGGWTAVYTEADMGRTALAIAPSNQNWVYGLVSAQSTFGLLAVIRSTDGGSTWASRVRNTDPTKLNTVLLTNPILAYYPDCGFGPNNQLLSQGWYDNVVTVDPLDQNRVWVGGIDLFRSDDGGMNWGMASHWWAPTSNPHFAHADQHVILFHPNYNGSSNKTMYVANDGGIFRTDDARAATAIGPTAPCDYEHGSVTWTSLNNGYGVTQFYHGLPYPNGTTYLGGTQDNGTLRGSDTGGINGWTRPLGGDGGFVAIDPTNTNILFAEFQGLSLKKSTNGGFDWSDATIGITNDSFLFTTPFIMDPSNSQRLWIGGNKVWRTTNGASSWSQASAPLALAEAVSAIAVAPTNSNRVLVGTQRGRIYRTDSGLTSSASTVWSGITLRRLDEYISWITFDPHDANIAYATISSFNSLSSDHHVFKSTNGGASWASIDGSGTTGIPDIPVHCIVVDPGSSLKLYLGTDLGVFVSLDGGASWNRENTGFANAVTESLAFTTVGGTTTLFAFTHGRGVWRVAVNSPPPNTINLALNRPAAQSSEAYGGIAARGVDGNTSGHFGDGGMTHSGFQIQPWWQVDLGAVQDIQTINVYNRTEGLGARLNNSWVLVSGEPFLSDDLGTVKTQSGVFQYNIGTAGDNNEVPVNRTGRYVRIQLDDIIQREFSLAEVQVWGTSTAPASSNLALSKPATQSSDAYGGVAARGVDGNSSGNFGDGHMTHTGLDVQPWWEVNLGASYTIQTVKIYNRGVECCAERLNASFLFVSNTPLTGRTLSDIVADCNVLRFSISSVPPAPGSLTVDVNQPGQYVRIQLTGDSPREFSLAEVEVMGLSLPPPLNVALNKPASQSSEAYGGIAARGVDGNSSGFFGDGHMTHTDLQVEPWWEVNLGASYTIQTIKIYNRTECCIGRLSDSYVFVSSTPLVGRTLTDILNDCSVLKFAIGQLPTGPDPPPPQVIPLPPVNRRGQYVRVQLTGLGAREFSLAEVEVMGSN